LPSERLQAARASAAKTAITRRIGYVLRPGPYRRCSCHVNQKRADGRGLRQVGGAMCAGLYRAHAAGAACADDLRSGNALSDIGPPFGTALPLRIGTTLRRLGRHLSVLLHKKCRKISILHHFGQFVRFHTISRIIRNDRPHRYHHLHCLHNWDHGQSGCRSADASGPPSARVFHDCSHYTRGCARMGRMSTGARRRAPRQTLQPSAARTENPIT
jgi:hypothetical protein